MTATSTTPAVDDLRQDRVQHGPFDTHYLESGVSDGPPVLLIHGSGPGVSGRANWQGLMRSPLADGRRLLAPDVVGFGETRAADGVELDHDTRVRHLLGFLDALGLDQVDVVGNSMGGALALALAHRHPERIRRMVLMGAVGIDFPITEGLDRVWGYTPSHDNMAALMRLFAYDQGLVTDELIELRFRATEVGDVQERYATAFAAPRQRHIKAMALTEDELASIQTPTLLIHGRDDQIIPLEATSQRLLHILPSADLVVFHRCGHWTQIERAEDFQRHVAGFFS
ncbi:MAG: 2-hydroxy-6-oxo-2,4-heptadienoate hydrolase [Marmoricola sp.]|nr:2-hydroxy-6-oxo-2,4-heptadienoate hydrolase [Marmoricola sp.]MDQ1667635.1 2-hydroxymuconate-semialdehyde hydrolase [Actinomycetota bacterium]MDQ1668504.1 2-hydroxymuconate-semialdehyde hydrolase [Actinomycetota bacterium]